jgi:hypothetical protein
MARKLKPSVLSKEKLVLLQTIHDAVHGRHQRAQKVTNSAANMSEHAIA